MTDTPPPREQFLDSRWLVAVGGVVIAVAVLALASLLRVRPAIDEAAWDRVALALADVRASSRLLVVRAAARTGDAQIADAVLRLDALGAGRVALALDLSVPVPPNGAMADLPSVSPATLFAATISGDTVAWPWFLGDAQRGALRASGRLATSALLRDADGVVRRSVSRDAGTPSFAAMFARALVPDAPESPTDDRDDVRILRFAATSSQWHGLASLTLVQVLTMPADSLRPVVKGRAVLLGIDDGARVPTSVGALPTLAIIAHDADARARVASGGDIVIREAGTSTTLVWLLPWIVAGALLATFTSVRLALVLTVVGIVVQAVLAIWLADSLGTWMPLGSAMLAWAAAVGGASAVSAWQVRRAQQFTAQLFSRFMTPALAAEAWRARHLYLEGGRPAPLVVPVTVLFLDLRGFTRFSEATGPAAVMSLLTAVTSACAADIAAHGGLVDDFAGDGIKADFGVPVPRTTPDAIALDARNAVRCAITLATTMTRLLPASLGTAGTQVRIGLHSGSAVAGTIGGASRLKYTVAGDVVNVAARLQSVDLASDELAAGRCRILLSGETLALLGASAPEMIDEGALALKGRTQLVHTYRVYLATPSAL